ncbi:MAG: ABC transporter substrate-binding protein [Nitrospirae bacterium]|nr:ABC transporter substrate-binding protein [Nitrospirota bacterium]
MKRPRALLAALLCAAALLTACVRAAPQPPLRIGTITWPGYEPLYLAGEVGKLTPQTAQVTRFLSSTQVLQAFKAGQIDAAGITLDEAMLLLDQGADPRVVLVLDVSNGADALLAKPGTQTLADLKGKRVGVEETALGAYMLARILETADLRPADITPVHVEANTHVAAFHAGQVDAVVTFEPMRTALMAGGAVELFNSAQIPGEVVDVLVVRADVLKSRPGQVADVVRAWFATLNFMAQKPDQAARVMAVAMHLTTPQLRATYDLVHLPDRDENVRMLIGGPGMPKLAATATRLHRTMRANHLTGSSLDAHQLLSVPRHGHPLLAADTPE